MNFDSAESIASIIQNLKTADLLRAPNRTLIDNLYNGCPPYSKAEVQQNNIQWNVNWQEGSDLILQAREQMENAHLSTDFAFTVTLPDCPKSKRTEYGQIITQKVNRLIKKSLPNLHTQREKWGSVILHGPGSQIWWDDESWRPDFIAISDLLIPTDTTLSYDGMNHFCAKRRMTSGQLFRKTFGLPDDKRDPGWKMDAVKSVFNQYKDINQNPSTWNWAEQPEKMAEIWKQNVIYFDSDAVPKIWMCDFFYQKDEKGYPWYRKILLDQDAATPRSNANEAVTVIYESEKPYAESLGQILHSNFIDGNNVPPFMYHSIRGLGMRMFDTCHALNRSRNQSMQKLMEDLMLLYRVSDPSDRSRLEQIYMGINYGIIPDGLSFVTRDQRYQIDPNFLQMQISQLKQLIGEGSQQFTQDIDTGASNKERTAFEVSTILQQTTRLTGSMLNLSYLQETFAYVEICRRLTKKGNLNFDAKRFRNELLEAGIDEEWIDSSRWDIQPVRVLGNGNSQIGYAQAQSLMQVRPMLNPEAQQQVLHDFVFEVTHDPKRANQLAPLDGGPSVTDSTHDTEIVFGSLMSGSMVTPKPGLVAQEVVTTMLRLMGQTVQQIMQMMGGVGTPEKVMGLQNSIQYTGAFIQQLAQDDANKQMVKEMGDALGQIANQVKAMGQRLQEIAQKKAQQNGENQAEMQRMAMEAQANQQKMAMEAERLKMDQQRLQMEVQKFQIETQMKAAELKAKQQQDRAETMSDIQNDRLKTASDIALDQMESASKIQLAENESAAKIEASKKAAEAKPEPESKTE